MGDKFIVMDILANAPRRRWRHWRRHRRRCSRAVEWCGDWTSTNSECDCIGSRDCQQPDNAPGTRAPAPSCPPGSTTQPSTHQYFFTFPGIMESDNCGFTQSRSRNVQWNLGNSLGSVGS